MNMGKKLDFKRDLVKTMKFKYSDTDNQIILFAAHETSSGST